jgi:hypothetical protein
LRRRPVRIAVRHRYLLRHQQQVSYQQGQYAA